MTSVELLAELDEAGVFLRLQDGRVRIRYKDSAPEKIAPLLEQLSHRKNQMASLVRLRENLPPGVLLIAWEPKEPPIKLTPCLTVTDVVTFATYTLRQLKAALEGNHWLAGNWSVAQLLEWLEQVGLRVGLQDVARRFANPS